MKKSVLADNNHITEKTKKELVKAATKLFAQKGYSGTTTRELAAAFGKSKGGLYHYVESKKQICNFVIDFTINDLEKSLAKIEEVPPDSSAKEALIKAISSYSKAIYELQDMQIFIEHVVMDISRKERRVLYDAGRKTMSHFEALLNNGIEKGEFKIGDVKLIAYMITLLVTGWPNRRWFLSRQYTFDEYVQKVTSSVLKLVGASNIDIDEINTYPQTEEVWKCVSIANSGEKEKHGI